jgi:prolyl 4-hydroxylase
MEPLQLVSYTQNQTYHYHTDWFTSPALASPSLGGNRLSSFFVYVLAENLTGGSTNFPILDAPRTEDAEGEEWCRYVDCDEEYEKGVSFRAAEGNAVFWENMIEVSDGKGGVERRGDERVLHAGLPVMSGRKVGMNIWTREGEIPAAIRGVGDKD